MSDPDSTTPVSRPPSRFSWALAFTILGLAALGTVLYIAYRVEHAPGEAFKAGVAELERMAGKLQATMVEAANVQPKITINESVWCEQTARALELAVISRDVTVERDFSHTKLFSTKKLRLRAQFRVKAGFNLQEPFEAQVTDSLVSLKLPSADILSVEQLQIEVQEKSDGVWNKLSEEELENELGSLKEAARTQAKGLGLTEEAEISFATMIREKLGTHIDLQYGNEAAVASEDL